MSDFWQNLLVLSAIGGCGLHLARRIWLACATARPSAGCGGGCSQCPSRAETLVTLSAGAASHAQEFPHEHDEGSRQR